MGIRSGLPAKIVAFVLHGRRARATDTDPHGPGPDKHAGLAMHYRPTSSASYGNSRTL
ncbi:hypothetical protein [Streptomyces catenulae]|uniref:Uncharacterized protein n=1 Tax=Streptomyces catenulae TaxID=66875 RepID=A0ABV2YRY5_9ACTN|nr:hypothetical protein [Streptomyces catenulae]